MSISNSYPTQNPVLNLNFATGSDQFLDSRISFSRADTPPTYAAPSAVHYWSNEKHLSSENLFDKSNVYDSGGWLEVRVDQTIGQTDPSGGTDAKLITQASGQTNAGVVYYTSTVGAEELTFSIYLKPNGRTKPNLSENLTDSGNTVKRTYFDLTGAGAVGTKDAAHTASIAKFGDWYRCTITFTPHAADSGSVYLYISDTDNSQTVADDGNGYIVYGANLSTTGQLVTNETSGSIHRSFAPTLKSVANAGDPRFEYDPTDGQSVGTPKGLLVESQASNLYPNSSDMTGNSGALCNVDSNVAVGPAGDLTADALRLDDTDANSHYRQYHFTAAASTAYTFSAYVKASGLNYIAVRATANFSSAYTFFNVSSGTVEGSPSMPSTIESVGNGWFRCSVTATSASATTSSFRIYITDSPSSTVVATGDSYRSVVGTGIQIEAASAPSSLISTSGATASRAADSCSVDLNGILADGQDVTLYAEGDFGDPAIKNSNRFAVALQENSNSYIILYNGGSNSGSGYVRDGGTDQAYFPSGVTAGAFKSAIAAKNNSFKYAVNGTSSTEDTAGTVPEYTTLRVGGFSSSGSELDGHVKRVSVYGQSLSSTELAALTS